MHLIWHSYRGCRHNHLWRMFWWSVKGCWFCRGSKIALSHWQSQWPLTQGWRYRAACDNDNDKNDDDDNNNILKPHRDHMYRELKIIINASSYNRPVPYILPSWSGTRTETSRWTVSTLYVFRYFFNRGFYWASSRSLQVWASDAVRRWSRHDDQTEEIQLQEEGHSDADVAGSQAQWAADQHAAQWTSSSPARRLRHRRHPDDIAEGTHSHPRLPSGRHRRRERVGQSVPGTGPFRVRAEDVPQEAGDGRESVGDRLQGRGDAVCRQRSRQPAEGLAVASRHPQDQQRHLWNAAGC